MTQTNTFIKMSLDRWNAAIKNADVLINSLTEEQMLKDIVPGKNRGIYLLGHLVAVHDDMLVLLNLGEKQYPELNEPFINSADKVVKEIPGVAELKARWTHQCEMLNKKIAGVAPEEWFERHTAVSAENFAKEPYRNKLNIILSRAGHLEYHTGQLALLK